MKNVVVFGGGTGLSHLLSGLKLFPVSVTAIISVADNGSSTGILKRELSIPAVGDVGKVMLTMANDTTGLVDLLSYRFDSEPLKNHPYIIAKQKEAELIIEMTKGIPSPFTKTGIDEGYVDLTAFGETFYEICIKNP